MPLPFVGVDGEGGDITDPTDGFTQHEYTMLRVGDRFTTTDYLPFLASQPKKQIYVSYFFDYDVTKILHPTLPEDHLRTLTAVGQVNWGDYTLAYRPRKEFRVKLGRNETTVNDVGTFFQCRFVEALKRWNIGTPQQRDIIDDGKQQRSSFGELTAETVYYNLMECQLLAELMEKFRRTCEVIGYLPRQWQGPGQLAKAMLRKHGIPKTVDLPEPPAGVWEMAQAAYYGGRFETSAVGPVRGPIEGWDIGSAYPYACTLLPCLKHGHWQRSKTIRGDRVGVYAVSFNHAKEQLWYGLPVRTSTGNIRFPRKGSGWYWGVELESAASLGARFAVHEGWAYHTDCACNPFDFMHRLYSIRKGLGKTEAGHALKLAMNSAYGVLAQSIGDPPYANPIYAGLITAITRSRLNHALAIDPYKVYMLATDGLFASPGLDLTELDTLGGWEKTVYPEGMHIVQPGVYFTGHKATCNQSVSCSCLPKTRGVPLSVITREETALRQAWRGNPTDHLEMALRQFVGLRLGVARNSFDTMGQWMPTRKRISYDWQTKRRPNATRSTFEGIRTLPYAETPNAWTVPYQNFIGGNLARDMDRLELADAPDWAETLGEYL